MTLPRKVQNVWNESRIRKACKLYAVTECDDIGGRSVPACVADAIVGGATFVQLRKKDASTLELIKLARSIAPVCRVANVPLVIDNDLEAAKATGVDGVHIGQKDISCYEARRILGDNAIIGVSAQSVYEAQEAEHFGANYIGVGPMFETSGKQRDKLLGVQELKDICNAVKIPVVAIGGLNVQTIPELAGSGVSGIAVISALFNDGDIEENARELSKSVKSILG